MLVFAAFTPHSPLLLPAVNKDRQNLVVKTTSAMRELADELYAAKPDTILLISEQPTVFQDVFSINLSDPYHFDMTDFGVLKIDQSFRPDLRLIDNLQRSLRSQNQNITLTSDEKLNYASAVPLLLLTEKLKQVKLVPVTFSELDSKAHFQFGEKLKDGVMAHDGRVAIIASGDMSHALNSHSPAGFHSDGVAYDQKIIEIITNKNTAGLLSLDPEFIKNAKETSYRPLSILFGLLERVSVTPEILSYEAPFDVGFLVTNFMIK